MKHLGYKKTGIIRGILMLCIFCNSTVYAADPVAQESITDFVFNLLGAGLNILYLITLPILIIAGKAMDNSMIYGEFLNLDKPLFMLRNLSRTFANFAVGGVILWKIVQYIFNVNDNKSPVFLKDLIIKSVGMVLAINFSRFAIGALLDLSTIATYSLGAMPLSILKETNNKDMPILEVATYLDYQSKEDATTEGVEKK